MSASKITLQTACVLIAAIAIAASAWGADLNRASINSKELGVQTLGRTPDAAHLAKISITVYPDGRGLPAGSGTADQGKPLYLQHCQACHGSSGNNGINDKITGGSGTLTSTAPEKTVGSYWPYATTLFDYIRRAMPYNATGTLTNDELYAITAYVLAMNSIIDNSTTLNAQTLPGVAMPNRGGFHWPSHATKQPTENSDD